MVFEQARALGFIYALVMFFILAYLWYTKRWTRRIGWIILLITVALGFLIFSPIIPWQFQSLVLRDAVELEDPSRSRRQASSLCWCSVLSSGKVLLRVSVPCRSRPEAGLPCTRIKSKSGE